jgi:methyl-accepting chemotaxis protein
MTSTTNGVLDKFEAITSSVDTVSQQENNIRASMEEQNSGSKEIMDDISRLNELTNQVKSGAIEMLEGSTQIITESHNLESATEEISIGINEMASGAEQVNIAVNQVSDMSNRNRESIDHLVQNVAKFKV